MNKKTILQTNTIIFWIILLVTFNFAQTNWVGNYEFSYDGGETAGGTKMFISHELKILKDGENLKAHLTGNGYMTYLNLFADVKVDENRLHLYFQKLGDTDSMGDYLKKGDLLLVLEEKSFNGKPQILTYWKKYESGFPNSQASGKVYFKKIQNDVSSTSEKNTKDPNLSEQNLNTYLEKQIRKDFLNSQYIYIAKVTSQRLVRSGTFQGRHNETVIDYTTSNRLLIEKFYKGAGGKLVNLKTNSFTKGVKYIIFANSSNSYVKAIKLDEAQKELEILERILAENSM